MRYIAAFIYMLMLSNAPQSDAIETYNMHDGKVNLSFDLHLGKMTANSEDVSSSFSIQDEKVIFNVGINSFRFSNPVLDHQFKHVYMEVEKFPKTTFEGTISEPIDLKSVSPQKVIVNGVLKMHGVTQTKQIPAIITVRNDEIEVDSEFIVKASEHGISIPSSYFVSGEDKIKVGIDVIYKKIKK